MLRYGIVLWGNCTLALDVFITQKRNSRLTYINGMPSYHSCKQIKKNDDILTHVFIYF